MNENLLGESKKVRVALFRGRGIISAIIRWQTWSDYSHAAIVMPDGSLIEAWHRGPGVRRKYPKDLKGVSIFEVDGLTEHQSKVVENFAIKQIGVKYDYFGVFRFMSRRNVDNKRWFCSELVYAAFLEADINLLSRLTLPSRVSPGLLSRSPLLFS